MRVRSRGSVCELRHNRSVMFRGFSLKSGDDIQTLELIHDPQQQRRSDETAVYQGSSSARCLNMFSIWSEELKASVRFASHRTVSGELRYSAAFSTSPWLLTLQADTVQTYWPMSISCRNSESECMFLHGDMLDVVVSPTCVRMNRSLNVLGCVLVSDITPLSNLSEYISPGNRLPRPSKEPMGLEP